MKCLILLTSIVFALSGCQILLAEEPLDTFERPYVHVIENGEVVKKIQKYPDLNWRYQNGGWSCINQGDFAYLIQFLVQMNGLVSQYEAKERGE